MDSLPKLLRKFLFRILLAQNEWVLLIKTEFIRPMCCPGKTGCCAVSDTYDRFILAMNCWRKEKESWKENRIRHFNVRGWCASH